MDLWSNLDDAFGTAKPITQPDRALAWTQHWLIQGRFDSLLILLLASASEFKWPRANEPGGATGAPSLYNTPRLISNIEVVNETPQLVIQIELANSPGHGLLGMEPAESIDRIIIGPSQFPWTTA